MNLKYILLSIFIVLNFFVYYVTEQNIKSKVDYSIYHHIHNLQVSYEVFMINQTEKADVIYETTINTKGLTDIISQAWNTKDISERDILRKKLHKLLKPRYDKFKQQGLLQYHFVFPDNRSFLRVHKQNKYGDDLSKVRLDFAKVNKIHEIIRGFSQGRTAHGFRNVYPLFDKNNKYIGAMEVSYPSELLQKSLNNISEIHSHFLVNKQIFGSKMWARNDRILNYVQSVEHKDYLLALSKTHGDKDHIKNVKQRISVVKDQIEINMKKGLMFSLTSRGAIDDFKVISFVPIYQSVTYETSAWIVAYDDAPFIYPAIKDAYYIRFILFVIFAMLLFFIYKVNKQKNKLSTLLSSYDHNVIFSTTDLKGNITHVSEAFCEISGYTIDELIGNPHNIVRHKDMPKVAFKNMWETLKAGKTWKGEVKNSRKDGGFYWVDAEIEPLYKDSKELIGYSAIRHNITDKKEIEEIQKEIIFTMGSIGESRSKETGNHVRRVAEYSQLLAIKYGLSQEESEMLRQASPMHDIGKVGIPDAILNKPGRLSNQEREIINTHAQIGYDMLNSSDRPLLKTASIVAYEHHEKWDGTGYPQKLKGENIHIYGRITAVADVFDALGSDRCYKKAWDDEKIFKLFKEESGKQFDPKLIEIFFDNLDKFIKIRDKFKDL